MSQKSDRKHAGYGAAIVILAMAAAYFATGDRTPSVPQSDAAQEAWAIGQMDPNHVLADAQIRQCVNTPGCDATGLGAK